MNFAKMMIQDTNENKRRIPRTTRAVVPVSPKAERMEVWLGRFSEFTG